MDLDLSRVRFRYLPSQERPVWPSLNPLRRLSYERDWGREISAGYDLFIDSSDNVPYFCHARRGVLLTHFPLVSFQGFHGRTTQEWRSRPWLSRLGTDFYQLLEWSRRFATHDLFLVNSDITRRWLRQPFEREGVRGGPPAIATWDGPANQGADHPDHRCVLAHAAQETRGDPQSVP
jgi:hypothetical protein